MPVTQEQTEQIIRGAHDRARALGVRITVAIVDEGGHHQALSRMDGSAPISARIAEAKAAGAALWHRDGEALLAISKERPEFFGQVDRLVRLPLMPALGSALLRRGDDILGAVGVSGATGEQDLECARAGLQASGFAQDDPTSGR